MERVSFVSFYFIFFGSHAECWLVSTIHSHSLLCGCNLSHHNELASPYSFQTTKYHLVGVIPGPKEPHHDTLVLSLRNCCFFGKGFPWMLHCPRTFAKWPSGVLFCAFPVTFLQHAKQLVSFLIVLLWDVWSASRNSLAVLETWIILVLLNMAKEDE